MKIGITGAGGFIGKHLVDTLKNKKNVKLSYFDLPRDNLLDSNSLKKFVANKDVIIHAAAVNRGSDAEIIATSVVGAYNLISAIKGSGRKIKLIFLSSIQAETETVFGLSKRLVEIMLRDLSQECKTPVTIFRVTNVFGEVCRQFYNSVVATFCHQVANNKKITIKNEGKEINFVYVGDLVNIIIKEIFSRRKRPFFFKKITTNNSITVKDLAKLIDSFKNTKNPPKIKLKFHKNLYNTFLSHLKQ
jgi:UDP-2-acetamido-2,6-beta-L-arabino-hexul-4-ose reductase